MDLDKFEQLYNEKYKDKLGLSYYDWYEEAPETEDEAYAQSQLIDQELKDTYDEWFDSKGDDREALQAYRERLMLEYELIDELFGLELKDT